jgi:hypothetical protein
MEHQMIERRRSPRRPVANKVLVKVRFDGKTVLGEMTAINNHSGATLKLDKSLKLEKNHRFEITFVVTKGNVSKLYFKMATVIHVTDGIIGAIIGTRKPLLEDQPLP